jgi:hypothetical protein
MKHPERPSKAKKNNRAPAFENVKMKFGIIHNQRINHLKLPNKIIIAYEHVIS